VKEQEVKKEDNEIEKENIKKTLKVKNID